ncbi:MAG TPA: polyprenyl synthetase family protein [Spirochaetales bacterium]|nr:polyprenyl synthetase family protein [Spirochaetales bacterium]
MSDFWKPYPELYNQLELVHKKTVEAVHNFPLLESIEPLLMQRGKMLRPAFLLIGSKYGKQPDTIIDAAAAIELLHIATLLHDDVLDDAALRRNVPTFHISAGIKNAILAGDWLFAKSISLIAPMLKQDQIPILTTAAQRICSSEIEQDIRKGKVFTSTRTYLRTIAGKTAALITLALRSGAELAQAEPAIKITLQRLGYNIGIAFQIQDDILDYAGDTKNLQKPTGKDIYEGICTLPLILALQKATKQSSQQQIFNNSLPPLTNAYKSYYENFVQKYNGIQDAVQFSKMYITRANREIETLPQIPETEILKDIVKRLIERQY